MYGKKNGKNCLVDTATHKWCHARSDLLGLILGICLKEAFTFMLYGVPTLRSSNNNQTVLTTFLMKFFKIFLGLNISPETRARKILVH